jgi:serine/threonine protein kinase
MTISINSSIGDYQIVASLGAGGMGEVYRAVHSKLGRTVAIKLLIDNGRDNGFNARFFNEARLQANLHHKNIATLYEFLEFDDKPCIVMEYIDGQSLYERIIAPGGLTILEAVTIFHDIVEAIDYMHSNGVVHRDIKSNNIKINSRGEVKLLDFGIAKSNLTPRMTGTGNVVGTWEYMAPEQLRNAVSEPRTDIWALGVLLYEMVTRRLPFESQNFGEIYEQISKSTPVSPTNINPSVPRELENIIFRCLKKKPTERYQSAQELLQDVKRVAEICKQKQGAAGLKPTRDASRVLSGTGENRLLPQTRDIVGRFFFELNRKPLLMLSSIIGVTAVLGLSLAYALWPVEPPKDPDPYSIIQTNQQTSQQNDLKRTDQQPPREQQNQQQTAPVTNNGARQVQKNPISGGTQQTPREQPQQQQPQTQQTSPVKQDSTAFDTRIAGTWEFSFVNIWNWRSVWKVDSNGSYNTTTSTVISGALSAQNGRYSLTANQGPASNGGYTFLNANTLTWINELGPATFTRVSGAASAGSAVDPGLVGSWESTVVDKTTGVPMKISFEVSPRGAYKTTLTSRESGTFYASNGSWRKTPKGIAPDQGVYNFSNDNSLSISGKVGTIIWKRLN